MAKKEYYKPRPFGKIGRPTMFTPEAIIRAEIAYAAGMNDAQVARFLGLSRQALSRYKQKHEDFRNRIDELKGYVQALAKIQVSLAIENGDIDTAKWYLKNTCDEFNPKQKVENSGMVTNLNVEAEMTEEMKEFIEGIKNDKKHNADEEVGI